VANSIRRYEGRVVIVVGGASGLGEGFAHRFAREGASVGVLDRDAERGMAVAANLASSGVEAMFAPADVTDAGSVVAGVDAVVERFGRLDVAVNSAGIGGGMYLLTEFPVEIWKHTIMVNLVGMFHCLRAEVPHMEQNGGSIINIASMVGAVAHPLTSAYVASKHGVVGLTKSAALEWGHRRIRVNAVGPTYVRTPLTVPAIPDEAWAGLDAEHAIGRVATIEEIASVVAFLGSDEASIVTGAFYLADGGYTAR
jgi:NAD(P)-dependent dehydrogenase (short-subunit alcohol dehydrogenase family)